MKLVLLIKKDFVNLNVTTDGEEIKVLEKRMFVTDANLLTVRNASSEKEEGSELTMNNALIVMRTITWDMILIPFLQAFVFLTLNVMVISVHKDSQTKTVMNSGNAQNVLDIGITQT